MTGTTKSAPVRILLPSLDNEGDRVVMRGVVDLCSLEHLKVDNSYQRERMTPTSRAEIIKALEANDQLPDIEIGMRGDNFHMPNNNVAELIDPCFIVDGYQRRESVREHLERYPQDRVRLGCVVRFNTNAAYERKRFHALNLFRNKVSPSLILRNCKEENQMIATLYGLSTSARDSVIYGRVGWQQNMTRGELITALVFTQVALQLHQHVGAGMAKVSVRDIPAMCDKLVHIIGLPLVRANVTAYWQLIDQCFGIRAIQYSRSAVYLRSAFLRTLARLLSDHEDFWAGDPKRAQVQRLQVPYELRNKLRRFPIADPEIIRLASAAGKAAETLYFQLLTHLNSGKRTKRLRHRAGTILPPMMTVIEGGEIDDDDDESENA